MTSSTMSDAQGGDDQGAAASGGAGAAGAAGGAAGGASAVFADAATGASGAAAKAGDAAGGAAGDDVTPAEWMKGLTQDADALKWLGNKAFADPAKLVDAFRETERAFRTAIPSENDPKERWDAFYKRLGRPDEPTGYEIKAPDGFEADPKMTEGFRQVLFDNGIPPRAASALVEWYNAQAIGGIEQQANAVREQQAALRREWGAEYGSKVEVARRGMGLLGLDEKAVDAMAMGYGVDATLKLLNKIGTMTSEDMLRGGNGVPGFTVDAATADARVKAFMEDSAKVAKLRAGDSAMKDEWKRLNAQQAAAREAAKKRA